MDINSDLSNKHGDLARFSNPSSDSCCSTSFNIIICKIARLVNGCPKDTLMAVFGGEVDFENHWFSWF